MLRGSGVSLWKLGPPELCGNGVPALEWRGSIPLLLLGGCRFPLAQASGPSPLVLGSPRVSGRGLLPRGCGGDVSVSGAPVGAGCELAGKEDTGGGRAASHLLPPSVPGGAGRLPRLSQAKCVVAGRWGLLTELGEAEPPWASGH